MELVQDPILDRRCFNLPTTDEVTAIVPSGSSANEVRSILYSLRGLSLDTPMRQQFDTISICHPASIHLYRVLFFPAGDRRWSFNLPYHGDMKKKKMEPHILS